MTDILKIKQNGTWVSIPAIKGDTGDGVPTGGSTGQVLKKKSATNYDTEWGTISQPEKISDLTDDTATNPIDKADTLTGLTATVTELNYSDGVTSNIQAQLNSKVESLSDLNITATASELNYCDGVTSNIQAQLTNITEEVSMMNDCIVSHSSSSILPSWWVIYKSGRCEQGGIVGSKNTNTTTDVSLIKQFNSRNYQVKLTSWLNGTAMPGQYLNGIALYSKSLSSFTIYSYADSYGFIWEAKGYIS